MRPLGAVACVHVTGCIKNPVGEAETGFRLGMPHLDRVIMDTIEAEIQAMVDRETAAWEKQDAEALVALFHPDMVWPWPPDNRSHDPALWSFTQGRFNSERWRAGWEALFRTHELVHNRRRTVRIQLSAEGDAGFAVVDVDTLWKCKADGSMSHWKGRAGKGYSKVGDKWLLIFHSGLLEYESRQSVATENAAHLLKPGAKMTALSNPLAIVVRRIAERLWVSFKRIASHLKDRWELEDYPIRVVGRDVGQETESGGAQGVAWTAQIINWWQMAGIGDSRAAALSNLRQNFENYRSAHDTLPRPGIQAPLVLASTNLVDKHSELARDFMTRILAMDIDDCFISDESSLWDFNAEETNDHLYRKIILIYGVDVSEVEGAKLSLIFERICTHRGEG